jgi:hypothetical protein
MNQSPRISSTQFRQALQFFAPGEILAPEQTLPFLRRKVASVAVFTRELVLCWIEIAAIADRAGERGCLYMIQLMRSVTVCNWQTAKKSHPADDR